MPDNKTILKQKSPEEINKMMIDNLGGSLEIHLQDKHIFHEQGLPFYTCIGDKEWRKEYPKGKVEMVRRELDKETLEIKEIFIRKIK